MKKVTLPAFNKSKPLPQWVERSVPIGLLFNIKGEELHCVWISSEIVGAVAYDRKTKKQCVLEFGKKHSLKDMFNLYADDYHKNKIKKDKKKKKSKGRK